MGAKSGRLNRSDDDINKSVGLFVVSQRDVKYKLSIISLFTMTRTHAHHCHQTHTHTRKHAHTSARTHESGSKVVITETTLAVKKFH